MISHKVICGVRETDLLLENSIDCCIKYKLFRTKEPSRRVLPALGVYHRLDLSHDAYVLPYPGPAPYACMQTPYASSQSRGTQSAGRIWCRRHRTRTSYAQPRSPQTNTRRQRSHRLTGANFANILEVPHGLTTMPRVLSYMSSKTHVYLDPLYLSARGR